MGWLPNYRSLHRDVRHIVLAASIIILTGSIALQGYATLHIRANTEKLETLAQQVIDGAEKSIDYAILSIFELDDVAVDLCSLVGKQYLRQAVHIRSVVKDVRVLDERGNIKCSAFAETIPQHTERLTGETGQRAVNPVYSLFNVNFTNRKTLGVARREANSESILVLVDLEAQLFAAFPAAIRDRAFGALNVKDEGTVLTVGSSLAQGVAKTSTVASSSRFPISFELAIEEDALTSWNGGAEGLALALGIMFGVLGSALLIRELRRPPSAKAQILRAVSTGEIQPYFQPIQCAKRSTIKSCEVLARWIEPSGKIISPAQFIPMAEASGTIVPMTRKLMQTAFAQLGEILQGDAEFSIAFNITPSHFAAPGFVEDMLDVANNSGVPAKQVTLEITEREGFENIERMRSAVQRARQAGFCVSLDDTGTGHNGLSHVQDIAADVIKIDKKFVDLMGLAPSANAIVEMLVGLARRLSMKTVAEGIETEEQLVALRSAGVDCFQGFLISKPLNVTQFIAFYKNSNAVQAIKSGTISKELVGSHHDTATGHAHWKVNSETLDSKTVEFESA